MTSYEELVVVTRRTRLEELIYRFNTKEQARFYIEHAGGDFRDYEGEHDAYQRSLERLRRDLDFGIPRHFIDRSLVPTYTFGPLDLVVTLGQDGLVANVAKYAGDRPIVGVNPTLNGSTASCSRSYPATRGTRSAACWPGKQQRRGPLR